MLNHEPIKVLLIGSLPPPLGGTSVSFQHFVQSLEKRKDFNVSVVDTSRIRHQGTSGLKKLAGKFKDIRHGAQSTDIISIHISRTAIRFVYPIIKAVRLLSGKKPIVFRLFGGVDYQEMKGIDRYFAKRMVSESDAFLVQTKRLVASARRSGIENVCWFPTNRPLPPACSDKNRCKNLVYMGAIEDGKGIPEILSVGRLIDGITIDLYGPLREVYSERFFTDLKRVRYCGIFQPHEAHSIISRYDALIFPTRHDSEGYPGVIIEALGAGLPVICSNIGGIPEIVDHSCGELIKPRDVDGFVRAVYGLVNNQDRYRSMSRQARVKAREFDTDEWTVRFASICRQILFKEIAYAQNY